MQEQSQPPKKKAKRVRKPTTFHTNDDNQDELYLVFPLTYAMVDSIPVRRLRAYKTALRFTASNNGMRDKMKNELSKHGGRWERPSAPPSGSAWSAWSTTLK